ncbi:nucleotidyltransferase family protein [bacterium]|nr:nucleotidyltransferase family protein [bacterium]
MEDYRQTITEIFDKSKGLTDLNRLSDIVLDNLKYNILTKSAELLLNLIFSPLTTQSDLDEFLKEWDIEVQGGHKSLMLSYFMKMHPELDFPAYVKPRLDGLLQFYRFQNLKLVPHYLKICNILKKEGIKFLIFKGGCMKHLRPELPRVMGDIDILVPESDYDRAVKILEQTDYDISKDIHSIDIHPKGSEEGIMDIHQFIILNSESEKVFLPDLFRRATVQKVFGIDTLVPSNEDMVFIALINMMRNLTNQTSLQGVPYTLFDCRYLIETKPDFDWNIVIQNANKTKTQIHLYFAIKYINKIVPELLSEKICFDKDFEVSCKEYITLLIYQRFYLSELREICREMKIKDLFSNKEFFIKYLKLKPKYFVSKMKIVKNNPFLAKLILKSERTK